MQPKGFPSIVITKDFQIVPESKELVLPKMDHDNVPARSLLVCIFSKVNGFRIVYRPLVSPEGWAGAGVGIGMVLVGWTPSSESKHKV